MASSPSTPKTMSSRLLTMKFMQRAAASTSSSTASTPAPPAEQPSSKRQKITHAPASKNNAESLVDQAAIRAAIEEEEKKVEGALLKRAVELGDAHWVLDLPKSQTIHKAQPLLNVIQVGFAQIDSADADTGAGSIDSSYDSIPALRRFNMDKKKTKKSKPANDDSNSDSESGSDSDSNSHSEASSSEPQSGRQSFGSSLLSNASQTKARMPLSGKKSEEKLRAKKLAQKRREKEVKLNTPKPSPLSGGISSISTGGGGGTSSPRSSVSTACYNCGQPGHKKWDCTSTTKRKDR
ncbi:hypothetical protein F5Y16DRAFT_230975 [Xylariaceae sp. FL0255]|nr:hypothetical protein F5Y16DRAFT_230975 [Xylariaceae sp. FL0255]